MVRSAHTQAAQLDIAVTAVVVDQSGRIMPGGGAIPIINGVTIVGTIGVAGPNRTFFAAVWPCPFSRAAGTEFRREAGSSRYENRPQNLVTRVNGLDRCFLDT